MRIFCSLILALSLLSCGGPSAQQGGGEKVDFKYASLLSITKYDGYTVATIGNPWEDDKALHTYILVPRDKQLPVHLPKGTVIRTPLQKAVVFTTVHCSLLMDLGCRDKIAGVADLKYIKIPWIQKQVRRGKISDCGDGMSPVIEKIIDIHPDAILLSPFENSGGYGKQKKADKLFAEVDESYNDLKQEAEEAGEGRSVMMDKLVGSVWYVPGGRSTIGQMIKDAGGRYPWEDDEHSGSLPLSFETVLEEAFDTEVWMFRYEGDKPISFGQFGEEKNGYQQFRAYQTQEVYGCNVRTSRFYEESPFHPDWLLNDFIHILHPDVKLKSPLKYYKKLN